MKHIFLQIIGLLLVCLSLPSNNPAQEVIETVDIGSFQVKVIRESVAFKIQFIEVVMPTEQYSLENLKTVWKYYCEKYPDKNLRLDLRIYTEATNEYNKQFHGMPIHEQTSQSMKEPHPRSFEAQFERKGNGVLAYGGDNEILYYCPDLTKPDEMVRLVLAGK